MVIYNTLMAVAAGLALILVAMLGRKLYLRQAFTPEGWALSFGVLGSALTLLGLHMTLTWPLSGKPPVNILFGEPNLFLGLLLLAAAIFLWTQRERLGGEGKLSNTSLAYIVRVLKPVSWVLFGLGLILLSSALAFLRFKLAWGAPVTEPITGRLHDLPYIENTFFVLIYGLPAIGCMLAPLVVHRNMRGRAAKIVFWAFIISGIAFLLFGAMNYYTHAGWLTNTTTGTDYRW